MPKPLGVDDADDELPDPVDVEAESSSVDDTADPSPASDDTAESSPAQDGSILDAVKSALKKSEDGTSSDPEASEEDKPAKEGEETPAEADPTPEELKSVPLSTRKRMERLLRDKKALTRKGEAVQQELESLRPRAEQADRFTAFVRDAGLSEDEVNVVFDIARDMKQDPFKAREKLRPLMDRLDAITGHSLPDDLHEKVRLGYLSVEDAQALATSQARARLAETARTHDARKRDAEAASTLERTVIGAVNNWDATQAKSDPDWKLKQSRIAELAELDIRRNGWPKSTDDAIGKLNTFRKQVETELRRLTPRKAQVKPANGTVSSGAHEVPKTMLDAVKLGMRRSGAH